MPPLLDCEGVGGEKIAARAVYEQLDWQLLSGRARGEEHDYTAAPPPAVQWNEVAAQEMQVTTVL
jgi:hypothetical protein